MVFWQGKCWQLPLAFNGRIIKAALPGLSSARIPWPQRSHKNTLAKVGNHAAVCAQAWMCASAQTRSISTFLHTWELDITWPCWGSCMWIFQVNILKADAHDGSPVLISVGTVNLIFFFWILKKNLLLVMRPEYLWSYLGRGSCNFMLLI